MLSALLTGLLLLAAPKSTPKTSQGAPKIEVPTFGDLPSSAGVSSTGSAETELLESKTSVDVTYAIVSIQQERIAGHPLTTLPMSELTSKSEPFSSLIRIKASQKNQARIDVSLLDAKGVALVSHSGLVNFRQSMSNLTDYVVKWGPFSIPEPGSYQMKIELDGKEMGIWPLRFAVAQK